MPASTPVNSAGYQALVMSQDRSAHGRLILADDELVNYGGEGIPELHFARSDHITTLLHFQLSTKTDVEHEFSSRLIGVVHSRPKKKK